MFLASGLSVGRGEMAGGIAGRGQAGPGFSLGMWGPAGGGPMGRDLGARLGRRARASCLSDSPVPPLVPVTPVCPHPRWLNLLSFRIYLATQCPQSMSKCPQDSWALLSRTLFPEPCPRLRGARGGHHVPHTKEGGRPGGGATQVALSAASLQ